MNKNVKIAKELVRLAKSLVAKEAKFKEGDTAWLLHLPYGSDEDLHDVYFNEVKIIKVIPYDEYDRNEFKNGYYAPLYKAWGLKWEPTGRQDYMYLVTYKYPQKHHGIQEQWNNGEELFKTLQEAKKYARNYLLKYYPEERVSRELGDI